MSDQQKDKQQDNSTNTEPNIDNLNVVEEEHVIVPLCYLCDSPEIMGTKCARCQRHYCVQDTNKLDSRYCNECLTDLVIEETKFTRTTTEYDEDTDTCHVETKSCKDIVFRGIDWMLQSRRISEMSDTEVKSELEYHRYWVSFLENELVTRSMKQYKMKVQADIQKKQEKIQARYAKITEVKSKKVIKNNTEFDPIEFAKQLLAMGLGNLNIGNVK